jgi:hypothetical protein
MSPQLAISNTYVSTLEGHRRTRVDATMRNRQTNSRMDPAALRAAAHPNVGPT